MTERDTYAVPVTSKPSYYGHLAFNSPLSSERADRLAQRLAAGRPGSCIDIGFGWGELLLRVLERSP